MSMVDVTQTERKIAERIDPAITHTLPVSGAAGGLAFANMSQTMEFAKMMAISSVAVPKHLRNNPGACLAIVIQAIEWKLSPYAVANKSYSVNDRLAYESQLVQAVILQRAPIDGRFKVEYKGDGAKRTCRVWVKLRDSEETVEYVSPEIGKITPQNSPLWKSDPDQQQFYYSGRALCRRHFPDVLLGVYADDEIQEPGPDHARDVTPMKTIAERLDALAALSGNEQSDVSTAPADDTAADQADTNKPDTKSATPQSPSAASATPASDSTAVSNPSSSGAGDGPAKSAEAVSGGPAEPTNAAQYEAHATRYIAAATDPAALEAQWKAEKNLRNKVNVDPETRDELAAAVKTKAAQLRAAAANTAKG